MIAAVRIARRLVRKLAKPVALWLATRQIRLSEERADYLMRLRADILPVEKRERERSVHLVGRRNEIQGW